MQLGVLLFLIAAGLTLVFGVMDFINLAHGVQYMLGAYLAVAFYALTGNFLAALVLALAAALVFGLLLEFVVFRHLYGRDHLDQVHCDLRHHPLSQSRREIVWGAAPLSLPMPERSRAPSARRRAPLSGLAARHHRIGACRRGLLYVLVTHTRIGMLVRAGATNAAMVSALGVDIRRLFMIVFGFGAMLAGFAGIMIAPILSVEPGMGDTILILAFVVIVIGGIGSIRGAFLAALLIGLVDTLGRSFAVDILRLVMGPSPARTVGPAIASMLIYLLMAVVLYVRPTGPVSGEGPLRWRLGSQLLAAPARGRWSANALPIGIFLVLAVIPLVALVTGGGYLVSLGARVMIFAVAAVALDLLLGYGGADLVRPRRLHRSRRLCRRHSRGARHHRCAHRAAGGAGDLGALRLPHRHRLPAHHGRLFHHDHARLRADGLSSRRPRSRPMAATTASPSRRATRCAALR